MTATGVVLILHVVTTLRLGYAAAGLVAAAATVGMAIGAPCRGRTVDRVGLRRALVPSIVAEAVVWGSAPFVGYRPLAVQLAVSRQPRRMSGTSTASSGPALQDAEPVSVSSG